MRAPAWQHLASGSAVAVTPSATLAAVSNKPVSAEVDIADMAPYRNKVGGDGAAQVEEGGGEVQKPLQPATVGLALG